MCWTACTKQISFRSSETGTSTRPPEYSENKHPPALSDSAGGCWFITRSRKRKVSAESHFLRNDVEELEQAKNDADQGIDADQTSENRENDSDYRDACKQADQPANQCTYHEENHKINDQRNDVPFFDLERGRSKLMKKIHNPLYTSIFISTIVALRATKSNLFRHFLLSNFSKSVSLSRRFATSDQFWRESSERSRQCRKNITLLKRIFCHKVNEAFSFGAFHS